VECGEDGGFGGGLVGGGGFCGGLVFSVLVVCEHFFEEEGYGAFWSGVAYFGGWCEEAQLGIGGDVFYSFGCGLCGDGLFGEVEAGDLESVEEEAGAAGVDVVGGDALQDLADGVLDGGAVFGERELEGGVAGAWVLRGSSRGVVVVAEVLAAQAWAAAAVAVGEDVAALEAFGCFG
jgi:hypothetical protein